MTSLGSPSLALLQPGARLVGLVLVILLLLFGFVTGIAYAVRPDRFRKRPLFKEGEMLRDWNQMQWQVSGVMLAAFCVYMLYVIVSPIIQEHSWK